MNWIPAAVVIVAVIASGVDVNHPDLSANIWANPGETKLELQLLRPLFGNNPVEMGAGGHEVPILEHIAAWMTPAPGCHGLVAMTEQDGKLQLKQPDHGADPPIRGPRRIRVVNAEALQHADHILVGVTAKNDDH